MSVECNCCYYHSICPLGGISSPKSEAPDVYSKHSATAGKEIPEKSSKKKKKKDKKRRMSDIDIRESLDENRTSRESPTKDESSLKSSIKDKSFKESPVRSPTKSATSSREASNNSEKLLKNDRASKGTLLNCFWSPVMLSIYNS